MNVNHAFPTAALIIAVVCTACNRGARESVPDTTAEQDVINQGRAYLEAKEYGKAIAEFSRAILLNPNAAGVYYYRGLAFEDEGNYESAFSNHKMARGYADASERLKKMRERLQEGKQYIHTVIFKNKIIPITVHCSWIEDDDGYGSYFGADTLVFRYDGTEQVINLKGLPYGPHPYHEADVDDDGSITVADYNFDNYMDIAILYSYGTGGSSYHIFTYDPRAKRFVYREEFRYESNPRVNAKTKTIDFRFRGGYSYQRFSVYTWENNHFTLIKKGEHIYDEDTKKFIRDTYTLRNGAWVVEKTETFEYEYDYSPSP